MTLNEMIDNVLLIARNSSISLSEHLSRLLIEKWIIYYRAMLIKQDIDKGRDINDLYVTTIGPINLEETEISPGVYYYVGDKKLPKLIDFNYRKGVVSVKDLAGNIIQIGTETSLKYLKYTKYACNDYIAFIKGDRIVVQGSSNELEQVNIGVIAEDPTELCACFDPNKEFPIPGAMISTITLLIMDRELRVMSSVITDNTNDSKDDTLNNRG